MSSRGDSTTGCDMAQAPPGGQSTQRRTYQGSCHCGRVTFELDARLTYAMACNCSICRRVGALWHGASDGSLRITAGEDELTLYQFNTMTAKHYFCSVCGIYTHHQRRSNPQEYGYNVGCLEGVNPFGLGEVPTNDGVNHPADRKQA